MEELLIDRFKRRINSYRREHHGRKMDGIYIPYRMNRQLIAELKEHGRENEIKYGRDGRAFLFGVGLYFEHRRPRRRHYKWALVYSKDHPRIFYKLLYRKELENHGNNE